MASTDAPPPTDSEDRNQSSSGPRSDGRSRGRGGRGGGGGGGRGRGRGDSGRRGRGRGQQTAPPEQTNNAKPAQSFKAKPATDEAAGGGDGEVCFICTNPISHYSIPPCNHITCHICALRLRALYKNKDCPHCRTSSPFVIFTDDITKRFDQYADSEITSTDQNIGIKYVGEDIVGDTVLLLRYNCPDPSCDFAGLGWPDLHRHVQSVHRKKMCDICIRHKKVFTHEHELFTSDELKAHMRYSDRRPGAADQTGFRGHPLCEFCGVRYYDIDKLWEHCRDKHERCFLCDRRDSRQPHYFPDYDRLEEHFSKEHYLCPYQECLEKKFVVFETQMDLQAHKLSEHGESSRGREARIVDLSNFTLRQRYEQERSAASRTTRRREPEPAPESLHSAQPTATELAPSRPLQGLQQQHQEARNRSILDSMESLTISDLSSLTPEQRATLTRHSAVIERASNLLGNDSSKIATFRQHISSYNRGSMTAQQLLDAFFALFSETASPALGTLVREVADLFEDKRKGDALNRAWNDWRAINEDYPSLPGLGGMRAGSGGSGAGNWAAAAAAPLSAADSAAAIAADLGRSARVLKLKSSTLKGTAARPGTGAAASSWAATASSSRAPLVDSPDAFPALPSVSSSAQSKQKQPSSWGAAASGSTPTITTTTASKTAANAAKKSAPPLSSSEAFPALPAAPKVQTTAFGYGRGAVRRDWGVSRDTGFTWGGTNGGQETGSSSQQDQPGQVEGEHAAEGKGKKKKKQVLVHWG